MQPLRYTFDRFELDPERRQLLRDGEAIHISPKALSLLQLLAAAAPRALSKQELTDAIWPDTFVDDCNLPGLIAELRSALDDDARRPRFLRTLHGFGYAFCGELAAVGGRECVAFVRFDGRELPLFDGDNVIGRGAGADVHIDDASVSRRHACISLQGGAATLADLGSKNGTFLGDVKVCPSAPLPEGSTIVIGEVRLTFHRPSMRSSTITRRHA